MPQLLGGIDVQAIATLGVVLGGAVVATGAGIRAGLKKVRGGEPAVRLSGGTIMDNLSMTILSERLRETAEAMRENTGVQRDVAHQLERLRDKL